MAADAYWQRRMIADRKLAERSMAEVEAEVRAVKRGQYLQISRRMDGLYAEAQTRGTLSRTKLWNYRAYREMEVQLREFCEVDVRTQKHGMDKLLGEVFENVIGQQMENFDPGRIILPYSPRAVIDTAWSGENYSARIWKNTNRLADEIRNEAQQVVMGLKSPGQVKRDLMNYYEVSYNQAARLIDTEVSYVLNKAGIENYRRLGVQKVTIITLDVNTCEKCRALQGQVFLIDDAPVIPIHPNCHCSYCVPADGDRAEVTASGADLDAVYAKAGVKGYATERADGAAKQYAPKGVKPQAQTIPAGKLEAKAAEGMAAFERPEIELIRTEKPARAKAELMPQAPADSAGVSSVPAIAQPETETAKIAENTGLSGVSGLRDAVDSGIIETYRKRLDQRAIIKNSEVQNGLPIESIPDSIADLVDDDGKVLKRRVYGENGRAIIDFDTGDHNRPDIHKTGAHKHVFDYSKKKPRGKNIVLTVEELLMNSDIIKEGVNYFADKGNH